MEVEAFLQIIIENIHKTIKPELAVVLYVKDSLLRVEIIGEAFAVAELPEIFDRIAQNLHEGTRSTCSMQFSKRSNRVN